MAVFSVSYGSCIQWDTRCPWEHCYWPWESLLPSGKKKTDAHQTVWWRNWATYNPDNALRRTPGSFTVWGTTSTWTSLPPSSWGLCPSWWKTLYWHSLWTRGAAVTYKHKLLLAHQSAPMHCMHSVSSDLLAWIECLQVLDLGYVCSL